MKDTDYNIPFPNVSCRKRVFPLELHRGTVVAFLTNDNWYGERTGVIVMDSCDWMMVAVNLYKEEGRMWLCDGLPDDIIMYEPNEQEKLWGLNFFLNSYCDDGLGERKTKHPVLAFIDEECPEQDNQWQKARFCEEMLSHVPEILEQKEWAELKSLLIESIRQMGGLQFNRFQTEYYCFMIGVLMIAEHETSKYRRNTLIKTFRESWTQFSWMYGIGLGRVLGSRLHNFTAVINQTGQNRRKHYLHLYLPLAERFLNKICTYNDDKPDKLRQAIDKVKEVEAREEQKHDLDELYGILFPRTYVEAMSSSRPAPTIEKMKEEMAAKDRHIAELETNLSASVFEFNKRYETLLHDFTRLAEVAVTFNELEEALCKLSRANAENVLGHLAISLKSNERFQAEVPRLFEAIRVNERPLVGHADQVIVENQGEVIHTKQ